MAMPEKAPEITGEMPACPLEEFRELWLETPEGIEVIPSKLVKNLISRRDGQEIKPENFISMIKSTKEALQEKGVVPVSKKFWDVNFVRHFYNQVQGHDNVDSGRKKYQMAEIDENVLEQLRELKITARQPVRSPAVVDEKRRDELEETSPVIELAGQKISLIREDEEAPIKEPSEEELAAVEEVEPELLLDDYLANIDTDDTIGLYLKEVSRVPLLTATEEVELAQRIEQGRLAREELAKGEASKGRRMELEKIIEDGWAAREHLVTANGRLAISVAKKYMGRGVPFLDLIQEGNIGLIRATKKFDYRRGHRFSTYATWWIRQAVTRAISDQGRTIRIPVHMSDQVNKMLRAQHQLAQRLGRNPSVEELADVLGVTSKKVEDLTQVARRPLSLETPTDDEEDSVLGDFIEDEKASPPDDTATYNLLRKHLREVLKDLPPREVKVLQLRYGLIDGEPYTLEEVGRRMGVTRERVRQIETQALSRLRHPNIRWKLRDYLEK